MSKNCEHVFAIVRVDYYRKRLENSFVVKEIVTTQEIAEQEVERLNRLNADRNCSYFWQLTRFFADGTSAAGKVNPDG